MGRRAKKINREFMPDPRYNSVVVARFINKVMLRGQKATAERAVYDAMDMAGQKLKQEPLVILEQAMKNVTPMLEVKPKRVGGATYQVPIEVRAERGVYLATRWLIAASRARGGKSFAEKLANEIGDAAQGQGSSIKKREDTHKMAEANKAFAHYRW